MRKMILLFLFFLALATISNRASAAEQPSVQITESAAHWANTKGDVQVFLVQHTPRDFSLFVAGGAEYTVIYHSRANSTVPIVQELKPKAASAIKGMQEYEFVHNFSKQTIWMALVFEKNGHRAQELTRTFYGDIFSVVPNGKFLKDPK
jgi:hypothetical protein